MMFLKKCFLIGVVFQTEINVCCNNKNKFIFNRFQNQYNKKVNDTCLNVAEYAKKLFGSKLQIVKGSTPIVMN